MFQSFRHAATHFSTQRCPSHPHKPPVRTNSMCFSLLESPTRPAATYLPSSCPHTRRSGPAGALPRRSRPAGRRRQEPSAAWCRGCWGAPGSSWRGSATTTQRPSVPSAHHDPATPAAAIPLGPEGTSRATAAAAAAEAPGAETNITAGCPWGC